MATFSYNIFKNPNNDGLYYADHFHDINSGINISSNYGHKHVNNNITHFRSPATTTPHLHRKWIVDESNPSVNGPVFRTQFNSNNFTNASLAMQPITRPFDYVPIITEEEVGGSAQTNSAGDYTTSTSYTRVAEDASTFSSQSAAAAQAAAAIADEADDVAKKINPKNLLDGMKSYLDYDQLKIDGNFGEKTMNILPLMSIGLGRNHGSTLQQDSESNFLKANNIKETSLATISGQHTHYFPVRGRVINSYTTNQSHSNAPVFPNNVNSNSYAKRRVSLMNFNIQHHNSFNLFH